MSDNDQGGGRPEITPAAHRKHLRAPLMVLRVKLDDGQKSFFGYAKNISRSGFFIATVSPREPGERFQVELVLPAPLGRSMQCSCEVVWKRLYSKASPYEPGMGLRFLDLPEEMAAAIDRWVRAELG
jgi:uncharacterized protein (TIGR02266 family)